MSAALKIKRVWVPALIIVLLAVVIVWLTGCTTCNCSMPRFHTGVMGALRILLMALDDADLEPLWCQISEI
jgi:coenzyme F420-reducing hydrogenase gamma subunit